MLSELDVPGIPDRQHMSHIPFITHSPTCAQMVTHTVAVVVHTKAYA